MALIAKMKAALASITKRSKPAAPGKFPLGGQRAPGQASDFESWPPTADRDPAANVAARKTNKPD